MLAPNSTHVNARNQQAGALYTGRHNNQPGAEKNRCDRISRHFLIQRHGRLTVLSFTRLVEPAQSSISVRHTLISPQKMRASYSDRYANYWNNRRRPDYSCATTTLSRPPAVCSGTTVAEQRVSIIHVARRHLRRQFCRHARGA